MPASRHHRRHPAPEADDVHTDSETDREADEKEGGTSGESDDAAPPPQRRSRQRTKHRHRSDDRKQQPQEDRPSSSGDGSESTDTRSGVRASGSDEERHHGGRRKRKPRHGKGWFSRKTAGVSPRVVGGISPSGLRSDAEWTETMNLVTADQELVHRSRRDRSGDRGGYRARCLVVFLVFNHRDGRNRLMLPPPPAMALLRIHPPASSSPRHRHESVARACGKV